MRRSPPIAGRYELRGLLGSGGMGSVYRARDARLGREVAVKVLGGHHAGVPEFVERFGREVESVASLDHPNVVRVLDSGEDGDGSPYMAMELVDGGTLRDRIRREGPLPPREAARVVLQVAGALGAAHAAGIVHRDVKPENVLLTKDGQIKVADFGIARATEATAMTRASMVLGTAPYLSPEQAKGEPVGPASDLYSLGVVLYEALTGRAPFGTGEHVGPLAVAMKHCTEPAPSPRAANRGVPRPLELVTLTLMRKRPAERHAGAAALADDLAAFLRGEDPSSPAVAGLASSPEAAGTRAIGRAPVPARGRRRRRRPVRVVAVALTVALAGVLALAFSPFVPMPTPVALVEGAVAGGAEGLDRATSPVLRGLPAVPEAPEKERSKGDRPGGRDRKPPASTDSGDAAKTDTPTPPETAPESVAPSGASATPTVPSETPPEITAASASASAPATAPADGPAAVLVGASAAPSSAPPGTSAPVNHEPNVAEPEEPPKQTPEPAVEEAPEPVPEKSPAPTAPASLDPASGPVASAPADEGGVRIPDVGVSGPRPTSPPPASARPSPRSEPAEVSASAPEPPGPQRAPAPQPTPSASAPGSAPPGAPPGEPRRDDPIPVEPPEVRIPEVDVPGF